MHKISIGFAGVAIINGVFIQETFKVASSDDVLMVRQRERANRLHAQKMKRLFHEADVVDVDGLISKEEWVSLLLDPQVKNWLGSMELDACDAINVFSLIDTSHDAHLSMEELVAGVSRLRGAARSIDL